MLELDEFLKQNAGATEDDFFEWIFPCVRHRAGLDTPAKAAAWWKNTARGSVGQETAQYKFMTQVPGNLRIRLEAVAGGLAEDAAIISQDKLQALVGADTTPWEALMHFEPASDSTANTHSRRLFFLLNYWSLVLPEAIEDQPLGASVYRLYANEASGASVAVVRVMSLSEDVRRGLFPVVQGDGRVYVSLEQGFTGAPYGKTREAALALMATLFAQVDAHAHALYTLLSGLNLSVIKSLVQKIIRARPAFVDFGRVMDAKQALAVAMLAALPMQSFNPHGGGIESGLFAMLKRVGVIIPVEDAWVPAEQEIMAYAAMGLVASRRAEWMPPSWVVAGLVRHALAAHASTCALVWPSGAARACVPSVETGNTAQGAMAHVSFLVENFMGGMAGDMAMLRAVVHTINPQPAPAPPQDWTMPIYHCIDQHCATNLIYHLDGTGPAAKLIRECRDNTRPMKSLFSALFTQLTGLNPRRVAVDWTQRDAKPLLVEFCKAQQDYWHGLTAPVVPPAPTAPLEDWQVALPYAWLAYALGTRNLVVSGVKWVWNLNPDALDDVRVAPAAEKSALELSQPSEVKSQAQIADENKREAVKSMALHALASGVTATLCGGERRVRFDPATSVYTVDGVPWEEFRIRAVQVPTGDWSQDAWCMDRDYANKVTAAVAQVPELSAGGRRLAVSMLRSFCERVEFPRPDRAGGAGRQGDTLPSALQWDACRVWVALARLCPLVVRRDTKNPARFSTPTELLPLRRMMATELDRRDAPVAVPAGSTPEQEAARCLKSVEETFVAQVGAQLRNHQRSVLEELAARVVSKDAPRAHFVWLDVGGGKTYSALLFYLLLKRLRANQERFVCLFATSRSAHETVQSDARRLGLPVGVVNRKSDVAAALTMQNGVIFAHHDTIKDQEVLNALLPLMGRALFVLDEAHLAMGKTTIRTAAMQFLARAASDMLLMTATPLRNTREEKVLREWMQMAVSFPCTENRSSFQVALNSMIHYPLYDNVPTEETLVGCADDEALVDIPKRMGGLSDAHKFSQDMARRAYAAACRVADRRMVEVVRQQVAVGRNVWVVCENEAHIERMRTALGMSENEVWVWKSGQKIASMPATARLPWRVGLVPIRVSTGYSATHFNVRVRGVYPSNQADRTQIDGRIARYGQPVAPVLLFTVHTGITTLMVNKHVNVTNFLQMAQMLNE